MFALVLAALAAASEAATIDGDGDGYPLAALKAPIGMQARRSSSGPFDMENNDDGSARPPPCPLPVRHQFRGWWCHRRRLPATPPEAHIKRTAELLHAGPAP